MFRFNEKLIKGLMALVVGVALTLSFAACSNSSSVVGQEVEGGATASETAAPGTVGSTLDQVIAAGTLRVAVPQDSPPFGSMNPDGELEGYDIEVAKLIATDLEVELELVPVDSTNRIPYLQTDRADLVISSLGANPERAKSIYFSLPYAPFYSGVFGPSELDITTYDDLSGYTVGVTKGSLEDLELTERVSEDVEISRFDDNSITASALIAGQVDVAALGNVIAKAVADENPGSDVQSKFVIKNSPCFIGVRRGDLDMLEWTNVFVMHKRLGGELDALAEQWFGETLELPAF